MKLGSNQNNWKKDAAIYSGFFVVIAVVCYAFFLLTGTTLIKYSTGNADGLTQTYTAYVSLKHMIQDFFAGRGWDAWNWSLGLGGDTFEYYGFKLFNPLTYIIIAFPDNLIDVGYSVANILREYLAGFTFMLCMREVKLPSRAGIVGALSYAFCGWMVEVIFNQGSFENAAIILPLLIMGTEKVFKKKSPYLFIVSVAFCVASGVVWTYISGIVVVVYFLARYHDYHSKESVAEFCKNTGEYILYGIIGILISSPFVLSILCSMGGATTHTGASYRTWAFALDKYLELPAGLFKYAEVGATSYSYICVSAAAICLLPLLVRQMKRKSTIAWIAVVMTALSLIPLTSKFFNAMSYPAGRWYFALMFFVIWATMECLNEETLADKRSYKTMTIWVGALAIWNAAMFMLGIESKGTIMLVAIGICCCFALLVASYIYYVTENKQKWVAVLGALVLIASITYPAMGRTCPAVSNYLGEHLKVGASADKIATTPERVVPEIKDDGFYRSDQSYRTNPQMRTKLKTNANVVYGNNSIYTYSSLIDSKWNLFNKAVGNNAGYYSRTNIISNDNRANLDYLFGVKYFLGDNANEKKASKYAGYGYKKSETIDGVDILKTDHSIGLGTAFKQYITESELMEYPEMVRDQVLLQTAVVADDQTDKLEGIKHASKDDITTSIDSADITVTSKKNITIDEDSKTITVSGGKGYFYVDIPEVKNCQLVLSFEGFQRQNLSYDEALVVGSDDVEQPKTAFAKWVGRHSFRDTGDFKIITKFNGIKKYCYCEKGSPRGFNDIENYNINLGYGDTIGGRALVRLGTRGVYTYDAIKVYAIPMTVLDENAESLEETSYKIDKYTGDSVSGTVNAEESSLLFLSIPYDKGWKAKLDGEAVSTMNNVDIGFTGIVIPAGEHQLELTYSHWGMKVALVGTLVGLVGLLSIIIRRRKNGRS
ncbi:MAG: YfhO family protein [Clostridiales bacterium]|nr:YfhO family protein [Candidatus Crickella equi]